MKTKLVYVLTCDPEKDYIEQAHMAVWSARYWNPDATIVLIVDDNTDALLAGKRGELLNYVSEKIVVPFEDATLTPMYRSRFIKTQVRELVKGDLLFVDCDTICCRSLESVDDFSNVLGAVPDSHVLIHEDISFERSRIQVLPIGVDLNNEKYYFSSGVIYARDNIEVHQFYTRWHNVWKKGWTEHGMAIDQPSFARANVDMNHIVTYIPDIYNCVVYTQNAFLKQAAILHISSYRNPSFLFLKEYIDIVKSRGLTEEIRGWIIQPTSTWMPFDYDVLHSGFLERLHMIMQLRKALQYLKKELHMIPNEWFRMNSRLKPILICIINHNLFILGACAWMVWERVHVLQNRKYIKDNICRR